MSDYISREKALKESYKINIDGEVFDVVQVETLLGIPSADVRENRWIPTTERLPENDTEVLYCDEHEVIGTCHFWNGFNKFKHSDGKNEMTDIVAWMYLPEPMKVGE